MSKIRIAVSGAGGGVGQSIIKSLQDTEYEVIALDGEPLAAGLYATHKSFVIPYASSPSYIEEVLRICRDQDCRLFFPGLDAELPVIAEATERFREIGTTAIVSTPDVINMSDDKLKTALALADIGVNTPKTVQFKPGSQPFDFPFIVKPQVGGARSFGVHLVRNKSDLEVLSNDEIYSRNYVAQEYIDGDEYTCGTVNLDGSCKGVIVMRRILRDGDTYKCFSVDEPLIEDTVRKIANRIKPFGACNVQLRLKDGIPHVFEINARCSGTTAARTLCGFNEPKMIADYICKQSEPRYKITHQAILRYWKELVVANDTHEALLKDGQLDQKEFTAL